MGNTLYSLGIPLGSARFIMDQATWALGAHWKRKHALTGSPKNCQIQGSNQVFFQTKQKDIDICMYTIWVRIQILTMASIW